MTKTKAALTVLEACVNDMLTALGSEDYQSIPLREEQLGVLTNQVTNIAPAELHAYSDRLEAIRVKVEQYQSEKKRHQEMVQEKMRVLEELRHNWLQNPL
jgi:hypothetical protein